MDVPECGLSHKNMQPRYYEAITEHQKMDSIINKKADTGGWVVILSKSDYKASIESMLRNSSQYKELPENIDSLVKVGELASKYKHYFAKKEQEDIFKFEFRTSVYYGLPKILKSTNDINKQNSEYDKETNRFNISTDCRWAMQSH